MAFDTRTLIWCIAVPAGIASCAAAVCWLISLRASRKGEFDSAWSIPLTSAVLAFSWWLSVALSISGFNLPGFWSDDAWSRMIWPLLGGVFLACLLSITTLRNQPGLWIVVGWLTVVCGALVMPSSDAWTDVLPLHRTWIALIAIATTLNTMALYRMADRNSDRWLPAVILAGLACPTAIGAATYGALFQTCLAAVVATSLIAVFTAFGLISSGSALIFPSMLFASAMIAAGRFYSYDDVSLSVYALALFAPAIIALSDQLAASQGIPVRMSVAGVVAISIVTFTVYRFLIA